MNAVPIIKFKGWVMLAAGALLLLLPVQAIGFTGGTLGPAGTLFTQLYGLVLLAQGWSMAMVCTAPPSRSECGAYVVTDIIAATLLMVAQRNGAFGALIYALIVPYAFSALLFSYCYLSAGKLSPARA
jgi:hypothetical protein